MWQLASGQTLRTRRYGDEFVLYNDLSGDTHLLGDSAMLLLGLLQSAPHAESALLAALAGALDCPCDAALQAEAHTVLGQLAFLCLIEPA
jgi:PqqD family protein of HPr-rel-A system